MRIATFALVASLLTAGQQERGGEQGQSRVGDNAVTVTGCLRGAAQPGSFVLTDVRWEGSRQSKPPAKGDQDDARAGQSRPPAGERETLRLAAVARRPDLETHVGHTVRIMGTLLPEDRVVTPGIILPDPSDSDAAARKPQVKKPSQPRVLNVRTVTRVADGCK